LACAVERPRFSSGRTSHPATDERQLPGDLDVSFGSKVPVQFLAEKTLKSETPIISLSDRQ
jgi:hypothetical protein